jgi:putative holliday junction resolvase
MVNGQSQKILMPRSLGLDIGTRRIGVALSDATKLIATPLGIIDRKTEDALVRLRQIVRNYAPDELVAGLPVTIADKTGDQATLTAAFTRELGLALGLPVVFVDEAFSSAEARAIIASKKRKQQPHHDDAIAASVILQRHLDRLRALAADNDDDVEETDDA